VSDGTSVPNQFAMAVANKAQRAQSAGRSRPPATGATGVAARDPLGGIRGAPLSGLTDARGDAPGLQWTQRALLRTRLEEVTSRQTW
jgi:hypothetical protein